MGDLLDHAIAEFTVLVNSVRRFRDLPCVCVRSADPREGITPESISKCTPCHINSIFDEALESAREHVKYIEQMAENHPDKPVAVSPPRRANVIRFQPLGRRPQPGATWEY